MKDSLIPTDDDLCFRCEAYCFRVGGIMACDSDDYDPTPWCRCCGAMEQKKCDCGPFAENE